MKYLLLSIILSFTFLCSSQYWGRNTESEFTNEAMDVEIDSQGNSYVAGYITGETAFDINVAEQISPGNGDVYISKYNTNGDLVWVKRFGGNLSDRAYDLAIDENDQVYVTGQFYGQVDFGGIILTSVNNSKDIFVLKMDAQGNVLWAISEGGSDSENVYGITTDSQNNVVLTGQFTGVSSIGGQTFTSYIDPVTLLPSYDLFLSKYDTNGNPLWTIIGQANYEERGLAVSVDSQDNIFLTGQFSDTLYFGGQQINNVGYNIGFLSKISPTGQVEWVNLLRAGLVMAYDLEVNDTDEVVVIGDYLGNFLYTTLIGSGSITNAYNKKVFCMKTTNDGEFMWGEALGSDNQVSARSISVAANKDIFITGFFKCAWTELRGNQTAIFNSVGFKDAYLWKLDNTGNTGYVKQFGSKFDDEGHGVAILNNSVPMICGSYTEDLNIRTSPLVNYQSNINSNFDLIPLQFSEPIHGYLSGDASRNSFLLNSVGVYTPVYNFFVQEPNDSLTGAIFSLIDSIHGCEDGHLDYITYTYSHLGPAYNSTWNTGTAGLHLNLGPPGIYTIDVERIDGCSSYTDSIIVHPKPTLPLMNDNLGLAINEPGSLYYDYFFCFPDSVTTWFSGLDTSYSIEITDGVTSYNDTLPYSYNSPSEYDVIITDSVCRNVGEFSINYDYSVPHDIVPYMVLVDTLDYNDSIVICQNNNVYIEILDSLENPNGIFHQIPTDPLVSETWAISPNIGINLDGPYHAYFSPNTTGWYVITHTGSYGYINLCGVDTSIISVVDSFYVEVNPTSNATTLISGSLLCPNGSVYLTLSDTISGFNWSGPGINWVSSNEDSIQATVQGIYTYSGYLIDTITGCSRFLTFGYNLIEKPTPIIYMNPTNGIVCPNDSVNLYVDSIYVSYNWNGPTGNLLDTTSSYWDDEQGFYFVIVEDNEGCFLTSAPVEIREYSTPYLTVEPTNIICDSESVVIHAIVQDSSNVQWISPIVSNDVSITVNQPGWYFAEMTQCGITVLDSLEIIDGSFSVTINASDSIVCFGEEIVISAPQGYVEYDWSNGEQGVAIIQVSLEDDYWITVTNQYGCSAISDTIFVDFMEESAPPLVADTLICGSGDVTLSSFNLASWYDSDSVFISSSTSFQFVNLGNDTTVLVAYDVPQCDNNYTSVTIQVIDSIPSYSIISDSVFCSNSLLDLSVSSNGESLEWFIDTVSYGNSNTIQIDAFDLMDTNTVQVILSNQCFTDTLSVDLTILFPDSLFLTIDSIEICANDELLLNTMSNNFDSISWSGYFGYLTVDSLILTYPITGGYIYAEGLGNNGCLTTQDSVFVSVNTINYSLYDDFWLTCEDDTVTFGVISDADSIVWTLPNGDTTSVEEIIVVVSDSTDGWYVLDLFSNTGCAYSDSIWVSYNGFPTFSFPDDTTICRGDFVSIVSSLDSILYDWTGYGQLDSVILYNSQEVIITATTPQGCVIVDTFFVNVVDCNNSLPNVITPNNDGVNDFFIIDEAPLFPDNRLIIVNRWGNVVYEENGYNNLFNGLDLSDGVYFYVFHKNYRDQPESKSEGFLTITR